MGRSKMERFYAFVEVDHHDLGEELVANGLARLHGTETHPPGMNSVEVEWEKLEQLERTAKQQKVGAWGRERGSFECARGKQRTIFRRFVSMRSFIRNVCARRRRQFPRGESSAKFSDRIRALSLSRRSLMLIQRATGVGRTSRIGSVLAARIVAARPFKSADDLRHVKGIGAKKYEKIRPFFD